MERATWVCRHCQISFRVSFIWSSAAAAATATAASVHPTKPRTPHPTRRPTALRAVSRVARGCQSCCRGLVGGLGGCCCWYDSSTRPSARERGGNGPAGSRTDSLVAFAIGRIAGGGCGCGTAHSPFPAPAPIPIPVPVPVPSFFLTSRVLRRVGRRAVFSAGWDRLGLSVCQARSPVVPFGSPPRLRCSHRG